MATVTFDTYAYIKRLRDAGIPEAQAEAFARAQQDMLAQALDSQLATKVDIADLRTDLAELRAATQLDIAQLRNELADLRTELKVDIANAKTEVIKWTAGLLILQAGVITALVKLL